MNIVQRILVSLGLSSIAVGHTQPPTDTVQSRPILSVSAKSPALSLDVYTPGPDGALHVPGTIQQYKSTVDANGVYATTNQGKTYYNVSSVSSQASETGPPDLDALKNVKKRPLTLGERRALKWITDNEVHLPNGSIVWQNSYPLAFDDLYIKTPWSSSFSQGDIIKALIVLYRQTGDRQFISLATKAAYAYEVPCEQGGLACKVGKITWFEEVPAPDGFAPLILNGHLFSVVMLYDLYDVTHDPKLLAMAKDGAATAAAMILRYDTGYWSIYQQRQRSDNLTFRLTPSGKTYLRTATLKFNRGPGQTINFSRKETVWGWWRARRDGQELKASNATLILTTGPLNKLADFSDTPDSTLILTYKNATCTAPTVGIFDVRENVSGYVQIPASVQKAIGDGLCEATYAIRPSQQVWSTLSRFYQQWHARLAWEVGKRSNDPTMIVTAFRWENYLRLYDITRKDELGATAIRKPVFDGTEDRTTDAMTAKALKDLNALTATREQVTDAVNEWARANHQDAAPLMRRLGISPPV